MDYNLAKHVTYVHQFKAAPEVYPLSFSLFSLWNTHPSTDGSTARLVTCT